ncbi:MAG: hypothetical protein ACM3ZO_10820 [Clostridia bacterium]
MKRMTLGTIALLGALAVVTVKLPSLLVEQPGAATERGGAAAGGDPLVPLPTLESVSPLVIDRGSPSPLDPVPLSLPGLAAGHGDLQKAWAEKEQPDACLDDASRRGTAVEAASGLRSEGRVPDGAADDGQAVAATGARMGLWMNQPGWESPSAPNPVPTPVSAGSPVPEGAAASSPGQRPEYRQGSRPDPTDDGKPTGLLAGLLEGAHTSGNGSSAPAAGATSRGLGASSGVPEGGEVRQGFVVLEEAARRHPLWAELAAVEQEMDACKAEWRREVDSSYLTEQDIDRCYAAAERMVLASAARGDGDRAGDGGAPHAGALVSELEETEARLREETEHRIEAYAAEVKARLDDDLYAERARLNQELDEFKDRTLREYYLSIFNAQLRLRLLKLPEDERKALQEKIAKLTLDMETKIDSKARDQDAAFAAYAEKRCAEAEAEIAAFRTKEEGRLSEKLASERAKLERSLAELLKGADSSLREGTQQWSEEVVRRARIELAATRERIARDLAAKEADFTARYGRLQARRDALYKAICDDIRAATRELGADTGMKVSVLEQSTPAPAAASQASNVTEEVLGIIRNR